MKIEMMGEVGMVIMDLEEGCWIQMKLRLLLLEVVELQSFILEEMGGRIEVKEIRKGEVIFENQFNVRC